MREFEVKEERSLTRFITSLYILTMLFCVVLLWSGWSRARCDEEPSPEEPEELLIPGEPTTAELDPVWVEVATGVWDEVEEVWIYE